MLQVRTSTKFAKYGKKIMEIYICFDLTKQYEKWNLFITDTNIEADFIRNLLNGYDPRVFPGPENTSLLINITYYMTQLQGLVRILCFRIGASFMIS